MTAGALVSSLEKAKSFEMVLTSEEFRLALRLADSRGIEIALHRVSSDFSTGTAVLATAGGAVAGLATGTWAAGPLGGIVGGVLGAIIGAAVVRFRISVRYLGEDLVKFTAG